jgi:hypothetical protein
MFPQLNQFHVSAVTLGYSDKNVYKDKKSTDEIPAISTEVTIEWHL